MSDAQLSCPICESTQNEFAWCRVCRTLVCRECLRPDFDTGNLFCTSCIMRALGRVGVPTKELDSQLDREWRAWVRAPKHLTNAEIQRACLRAQSSKENPE